MDLHLKQWRNQQQQQQHESEEQEHQPSAKIPKLLLDLHPQHASSDQSSALPLFVSSDQSNTTKISGSLSAPPPLSDSTTRMDSYFSLAQWQELELQALIYRYMLAGAAVPPELLQPIKKSLVYSSAYFLHHPLQHHFSHYQTPLLQSGYWGRAAMDPEPGRCRRTDGKKWRCSRDVVTGQKYCERHVHRGRNRSRKPVEMQPTSSSTVTVANNNAAARFGAGASAIGCGAVKASSPLTASPFAAVSNGPNNFGLSRPSPPIDLLQLNHSSSDSKNEHKGLFEAQSEVDNRSDGHILRHFFDDWPRTLQDPDNNGTRTSPMNSATSLSISMPGNSSSDVSLKLSTGNGDQLGPSDSGRDHHHHHHQPSLNWGMGGWSGPGSMGGPLAEALRSSSMSNSSPTSVLHQLPRGSTSEISYVST